MKITFAILAGLPLLALATPAAAQKVSDTEYKSAIAFADCALAANAGDVQAVLAAVPGSAEDKAATRKLTDTTGCPAKPKASALRGALAERLYVATYASAPAEAVDPAVPFTGSGDATLANWDVTRCAAQRDPVGADMLIRAELRSGAENEALKRFVPQIGNCTPSGAKIGFDREKLRGLVAEGLIVVRKASAN